MSRLALGCLAVLAAAGLTAGTGQARPSPDELAKRLQARYETIRSFSAGFTQSYEGGLLRLSQTERGEITLKKPGRFRMVYTAPERREFVADGAMLYSYFPADKIGRRDPLPKAGEASTALLFIAGQGSLVTDFTAAMPAAQPEGEWHLELTPRTPQADFETLTLVVDRGTLRLVGFTWTDADGGTATTRFTDLRENVNVSDREFEFAFPKGTFIER